MRCLFFIFILLSALQVQAKSLVLTLVDGTSLYYLLGGETNPVMRFSEDSGFSVNADNYEFSGVKNFYISTTDASCISKTKISKTSFHSGFLSINAASVAVFTLDGKNVDVISEKSGDMITIDMSSLPKGIYVIKAGKSSFKVCK